MRLKKLTIHNIASIKDAVIDFEKEPLASSEVFLITGKTGAGKSTILDAICLALYANTPRLDTTKMQGDTQDGERSVKIDDTRQLMRRNTGEAYVSLTFTGNNDFNYEASWSVCRARKSVTGNLQKKEWQLKNIDTNHAITKDREIEAEIKRAIGLDFKQFCRTTMLAQGEFTRFLNSKDDEKAEILEKITGVDTYSKIGKKIYEITKEKERYWSDARNLIENSRTLTEEEILCKQSELKELEKEFGEYKTINEGEVSKRDWINEDINLSQSVKEATNALNEAKSVVESEEFKEIENLVKEWNITIDARGWLSEIRKAEDCVATQEKNLNSLSDEFARLLGGQLYSQQQIKNYKERLDTIDNFLDSEKENKLVYENSQTIVGYLNTISEGRGIVDDNLKIIYRIEKDILNERKPALEDIDCRIKKAESESERLNINLKRKEDSLEKINIQLLRRERDTTNDFIANIATAKERVETAAREKMRMERVQESITKQLSEINAKQKRSEELDTPIREAKIAMESKKECLDKQSDTVDKFATTLRQKLKIGDTCPICRQKIVSELPHEEELVSFVNSLKELYEEAKKGYETLVDEKRRVDAEIKTELAANKRDCETFEKDNSVKDANQKATEACNACKIESVDENTLSLLNDLDKDKKAQKEKIDVKIKEGELIENEIREIRKEFDEKRGEIDLLKEKRKDIEKIITESNREIAISNSLIESKKAEIAYAETKINELIGNYTNKADWKGLPKEFASQLICDSNRYNLNVTEKQNVTLLYEKACTNYTNANSVFESILNSMPEWKSIKHCEEQKIENLIDEINIIDNSVSVAQSELKSAKKRFKTDSDNLNSFLKENEALSIERLTTLCGYSNNDILTLSKELDKYKNDVVAKRTLLKSATEKLEEHKGKRPEITEEESLLSINLRIEEIEKQLNKISEAKGAITQELKTDAENKKQLKALIKDCERKREEYQKWGKLDKLIGDATGNKFRKIAQSYVLSSLIHSANGYMKSLTDRYTLKVTPGTFVISLEDAYQGYVSRAASTISGGESFLVSLSLALALSDIGQRLSVDTLFIDEGFGSLSGEPLQNAINTLRSLHTKAGRHVGIISHVEELQERIPVQIKVEQEGNKSHSKIAIVS